MGNTAKQIPKGAYGFFTAKQVCFGPYKAENSLETF